jgi:hypothetical protein
MWASAILALIKAVPGLLEVFQQVQDLYWKEQDRQLEASISTVRDEREKLLAEFKLPTTTTERRNQIRRRLYELQGN